MKPFHTIAIPHDDILAGRLTMDVFAADLWEVSRRRGADEYKDADTFFKKTYMTHGLHQLLTVVQKRIGGGGGDPVIQLQTPFGGGKTHALIALYHKAAEWGVRPVVIVGTALSTDTPLWVEMERQISGKVGLLPEKVSPGKEKIIQLLSAHQPILLLMDEILEYATKAAGVPVGASTLAAQTIAFMQELTEAIATLEKVCCVITLPASILEHYDEGAERLFQQLQKVSGRVEKIYTPVEEHEIAKIIRQRLFSHIDIEVAKESVSAFVDYADREDILPAGTQRSEYKRRFLESFPFLPEVIDVLYHRWGSFPTFQRTRGVLRLLSLVVHSLKESKHPYISLADFDLSQQEIRQELLKHIGSEYNSVIGADITDAEAGSKKVNKQLGHAYQGLQIGTRAATVIFLYSFSGGQERGANLLDIKRAATTMENPSPLVVEAIEQLKAKLFYLQSRGDRYYFSNQANLNRILLNAMENIRDEEIKHAEKQLLQQNIGGQRLRTYIWEEKSENIIDSENLKLVILPKKEERLINQIIKNKGQTPRVYRNTLLFLYPLESQRNAFNDTVKRRLAYERIQNDAQLALNEDQKKEVKEELKKSEGMLYEAVRSLYRLIAVPQKEGFKEKDMGIPTYGYKLSFDEDIYNQLRLEGEILENIAPLVIKEKYLSEKDYIFTAQLYRSALQTPGEPRPCNENVFSKSLTEGVMKGLFGLGEYLEEGVKCIYFKESATPAFTEREILIKQEICEKQWAEKEKKPTYEPTSKPSESSSTKEGEEEQGREGKQFQQLSLEFKLPKGQVSSMLGVMNYLQSKFDEMEVELKVKQGTISQQEIEDRIGEAFRQMGVEYRINESFDNR